VLEDLELCTVNRFATLFRIWHFYIGTYERTNKRWSETCLNDSGYQDCTLDRVYLAMLLLKCVSMRHRTRQHYLDCTKTPRCVLQQLTSLTLYCSLSIRLCIQRLLRLSDQSHSSYLDPLQQSLLYVSRTQSWSGKMQLQHSGDRLRGWKVRASL
jgi:hypothetical protein